MFQCTHSLVHNRHKENIMLACMPIKLFTVEMFLSIMTTTFASNDIMNIFKKDSLTRPHSH